MDLKHDVYTIPNIMILRIVIPNSVKSIGSCAFSNCSSLSNIVIPNSVTIIGFNTFYRCDSLSSADKDDIITRFGKMYLDNCY